MKTPLKIILVSILALPLFFISATPVQAGPLDFLDPCSGFIGKTICEAVGGVFGDFARDLIRGLAGIINGVITFLAGLFYAVANDFIKTALDENYKLVTDPNQAVVTGHSITLGIANMGFLVALIIIAFATMFRQEGFGYKKALPRLVVAALLVNFGFFIVTNWLIKPTNQIVSAFDNASQFDPSSSFKIFKDASNLNLGSVDSAQLEEARIKREEANRMKNAYEAAKGGPDEATQKSAYERAESVADQADKDAEGTFINTIAKAISGVLFTAVFHFLGILALFAFALMLFIRYITLSVLIILLPLAWVSWIFPNLKVPGGHPWSLWWEHFTRWLLFAPFAMFFFFLAVNLANTYSNIQASGTIAGYLGSLFTIIGLLLLGLIVSNKMGISGGAMALGAAVAMKGWASTKFKSAAINLGHRALMGGLEDEKALKPWVNKALQFGKGAKGWKGALARPAGAPIAALARRAVRATDKLEEARKAAAVAKVQAGAPYRQQASMAGLSEFEKLAGMEDLLDRGYAWEHNEFWKMVTELGLDPNKAKKLGHRRLEIKLNDAGLNIEAVAAVKPLEDFEMSEIRPDIEKRVRSEMKGKSESDIGKAIEKEVADEIGWLESDDGRKTDKGLRLGQLKSGIEWTKRTKMKEMINILKTNEIPKIEKRLHSGHKGYYGNKSQLSHNTYGGNLRSIISEVRPQAMSGARNNSRGDGVVNWDITAEAGIERENEFLVQTKVRVEKVARADAKRTIEDMLPKDKIRYIEENAPEVAKTIKSEQLRIANEMIDAAINVKTGNPLSAEDKKKFKEAEEKRIAGLRDEDVVTLASSSIQQLHRIRRGGFISSLIG